MLDKGKVLALNYNKDYRVLSFAYVKLSTRYYFFYVCLYGFSKSVLSKYKLVGYLL